MVYNLRGGEMVVKSSRIDLGLLFSKRQHFIININISLELVWKLIQELNKNKTLNKEKMKCVY